MLFIDLTVEVIGKPEPRDWKNNEGQTMKSRNSDVAKWIIQQPEVMQKIFDMANRHGFIKYNPETKTWQGVDCGD